MSKQSPERTSPIDLSGLHLVKFSVQQISRSGGGSQLSVQKKERRGRPRKDPTSIHLTLLPDQLAGVDGWANSQKDKPSRPEAIRRLIEIALSNRSKTKGR